MQRLFAISISLLIAAQAALTAEPAKGPLSAAQKEAIRALLVDQEPIQDYGHTVRTESVTFDGCAAEVVLITKGSGDEYEKIYTILLNEVKSLGIRGQDEVAKVSLFAREDSVGKSVTPDDGWTQSLDVITLPVASYEVGKKLRKAFHSAVKTCAGKAPLLL